MFLSYVVRDGIKINRRGYAFASKLYSKSVEKILLTNCLYVSLPRVAGLQNLPASPLLVLRARCISKLCP